MSDHRYWEYRDEQLAHPAGRAQGGEPCVVCEEPIPAGAHWKHRDRHACSSRCNRILARRFSRARDRGDLDLPEPMLDPYADRAPLVFGTDLDGEFPYGFLGLSPRAGDFVVRHEGVVSYNRVELPADELEQFRMRLEADPDPGSWDLRWKVATCTMMVVHESGHAVHATVDDHGTLSRLVIGQYDAEGRQVPLGCAFEWEGRTWRFHSEWIRHVEGDDPITWHAWVAVPDPAPEPWKGTMWTPEYQQRSDTLKRISSSTTRHARRLRMRGPGGTVERIDPQRIYERDGWICQLCLEPIDPARPHPDGLSASLDHVIALAAGGTHTHGNVQASHLNCNVRKGARG